MRKSSSFKGDQRHNKCLLLLKYKLPSALNSCILNLQKSSIKMDASQVGLRAVLTQEYKIKGKKIFTPVCFARRPLKGAKRQYIVTDQIGPAVV